MAPVAPRACRRGAYLGVEPLVDTQPYLFSGGFQDAADRRYPAGQLIRTDAQLGRVDPVLYRYGHGLCVGCCVCCVVPGCRLKRRSRRGARQGAPCTAQTAGRLRLRAARNQFSGGVSFFRDARRSPAPVCTCPISSPGSPSPTCTSHASPAPRKIRSLAPCRPYPSVAGSSATRRISASLPPARHGPAPDGPVSRRDP